LIFNPWSEWFDRTKVYRLYLHQRTIKAEEENESTQSQKRIADFVQFFQINKDEFDPPNISDYPNFQEFFIRKHAPNSRPISDMNDDVRPLIHY